MRKFTLLLTLLAFVFGSFAQDNCTPVKANDNFETIKAKKQATREAAQVVYWYEDFNGTRWSSTVQEDAYNGYKHIVGSEEALNASFTDGNNKGYVFHWSDIAPRGRYTGTPGSFDPNTSYFNAMPGTDANGFLVLESDFYNTDGDGEMVGTPLDMDATALFGPIDLSSASSVEISFNQFFRFCCSASTVLSFAVSADYDPATPEAAHWFTYDAKAGTVGNDFPLVEARTIQRNISDVAAGQKSVYIKFIMNTGSHYFWMIDDIKINSVKDSRVFFTDTWVDYWQTVNGKEDWEEDDYSMLFIGGYTNIPQEIVAPYVQTRAAVVNEGTQTQTVKLNTKFYKNGTKVYDEVSEETTIGMLENDTLKINKPFFSDEIGSYMVSSTLIGAIEGNVGKPTGFGYTYNVTENYYSSVYEDNIEDWTTAGPADWADGGLDGDICANEFDLFVNNNINSVTIAGTRVYIPYYNEESLTAEIADIKDGKFSMRAVALQIDSDHKNKTVIAKSEIYYLSIEDTATWVYLPFIDEANLVLTDKDKYSSIAIGIETFTGGDLDANRRRFLIGSEDDGPKQPYGGGWVWLEGKLKWSITHDNYAIDLYLNEMPTAQVNVTFNLDMTNAIANGDFVATSDKVYVSGDFNNWLEPGKTGSIELTDADGDKTYTAVVEVNENYGQLAYKYYKNAGFDNPESANNRTVTVAASNVAVNDTWNVTSVEQNMLANVRLFPNPVNGTLFITGLQDANQIIVTNILGQTVKTISAVSQKVEISTSELNSGVYMITIVDKNNNQRVQRIVKQ